MKERYILRRRLEAIDGDLRVSSPKPRCARPRNHITVSGKIESGTCSDFLSEVGGCHKRSSLSWCSLTIINVQPQLSPSLPPALSGGYSTIPAQTARTPTHHSLSPPSIPPFVHIPATNCPRLLHSTRIALIVRLAPG